MIIPLCHPLCTSVYLCIPLFLPKHVSVVLMNMSDLNDVSARRELLDGEPPMFVYSQLGLSRSSRSVVNVARLSACLLAASQG